MLFLVPSVVNRTFHSFRNSFRQSLAGYGAAPASVDFDENRQYTL